MDKLYRLRCDIASLCVYHTAQDTAMAALSRLLAAKEGEALCRAYADFFRALDGASLKAYISSLILCDDNAFTRAAAAGNELPAAMLSAVQSDLKKLNTVAGLTKDMLLAAMDGEAREALFTMPAWETGEALPPLGTAWEQCADALCAYHRTHGYGIFEKYHAFQWREGALLPVRAPDDIVLADLKRYERQKQQVLENTQAFLDGLPANNILLYGDRGTGKSSTVHAVLNACSERGLRMIEIAKRDLGDLWRLREMLAESPLKFIVFIDDLTLSSEEDSFGELKAALEGSLSGKQSNLLIYATSNRRHLVREKFSDRENDVHRSDTVQEELSLSDRFGIAVYYENPDKDAYLDIVTQLAGAYGIDVDKAELLSAAELWARRRGGRSPRCARQFVDYVESCIKRNIKW